VILPCEQKPGHVTPAHNFAKCSIFILLSTETMTTLQKVHREQDSKAQRMTLTAALDKHKHVDRFSKFFHQQTQPKA